MRRWLIIVLVVIVLLAGGGYFAMQRGLLSRPNGAATPTAEV